MSHVVWQGPNPAESAIVHYAWKRYGDFWKWEITSVEFGLFVSPLAQRRLLDDLDRVSSVSAVDGDGDAVRSTDEDSDGLPW